MKSPVRHEYVTVHGLWLPCEYESCQDKVIIRCLGDIDRVCLDLPRHPIPLDDALEQYFAAVPESRKMVVLVPREGVSREQWACRQALKRDLAVEIEEHLACAAA
jgi:hypothetical protein